MAYTLNWTELILWRIYLNNRSYSYMLYQTLCSWCILGYKKRGAWVWVCLYVLTGTQQEYGTYEHCISPAIPKHRIACLEPEHAIIQNNQKRLQIYSSKNMGAMAALIKNSSVVWQLRVTLLNLYFLIFHVFLFVFFNESQIGSTGDIFF